MRDDLCWEFHLSYLHGNYRIFMSFQHSIESVAAGGVTVVVCISLVGGFFLAFIVGLLVRRLCRLLVELFIKPPKGNP